MGDSEKSTPPSYNAGRSQSRMQTGSDNEPKLADVKENSSSRSQSWPLGSNPNFVPLSPFSQFALPQPGSVSQFPPLPQSPSATTFPTHHILPPNSYPAFQNDQRIPPHTQQNSMWSYAHPAQASANNPPLLNIPQASTNSQFQGQYSFPAYYDAGPSRLPPTQPSGGLSPQSPSSGASPPDQSRVDTEDPGVMEDKRRRNTAASARFRIKKKQKSFNLERTVADLTIRADELEKEASDLRKENAWLKDIVIMKGKRNMIESQGPEPSGGQQKYHDETAASSAEDSDVNEAKGGNKGKGKERENSGKGKGRERQSRTGVGKKEKKS